MCCRLDFKASEMWRLALICTANFQFNMQKHNRNETNERIKFFLCKQFFCIDSNGIIFWHSRHGMRAELSIGDKIWLLAYSISAQVLKNVPIHMFHVFATSKLRQAITKHAFTDHFALLLSRIHFDSNMNSSSHSFLALTFIEQMNEFNK